MEDAKEVEVLEPDCKEGPLTIIEQNAFEQLEHEISKGIKVFYRVGKALLKIRDNRLYRGVYNSFPSYCKARWEMSGTHADRLIGATKAYDNVAPIGVAPANESQARCLTALDPDMQREAWQTVVDLADGAVITAKQVQSVVESMLKPVDGGKEQETEKIKHKINGAITKMYDAVLEIKNSGWSIMPKEQVENQVNRIIELINV